VEAAGWHDVVTVFVLPAWSSGEEVVASWYPLPLRHRWQYGKHPRSLHAVCAPKLGGISRQRAARLTLSRKSGRSSLQPLWHQPTLSEELSPQLSTVLGGWADDELHADLRLALLCSAAVPRPSRSPAHAHGGPACTRDCPLLPGTAETAARISRQNSDHRYTRISTIEQLWVECKVARQGPGPALILYARSIDA
jgi:hypothetical protein